MHTEFSKTLRALENEHRRASPWGVLLAVFLLGTWLGWAGLSRVAVLEVSERARVEVESPPLSLSAPVAGRLTLLRLSLNQRVERGQVLAELDSSIERRHLQEEQVRLANLDAELSTLRRELDALRAAQRAEQQVARLSGRVADARLEEAIRRVAQAEDVAARYRKLEGAAAEADIRRTQAEAGQQQAAQTTRQVEAARQRGDQRMLKLNAQVRLEALDREQAVLAGRRATTAAVIATLEAEIERRTLRAPALGYIDAVAPLGIGAFVQAGDSLGVLLPLAPLHVVASYQPSAAFGRIAPGQYAWMRLAGFPFTQYGRLPLRVMRRANETREGLVRVELTIDTATPFAVPLQHGLPGAVDIEVERVSPLRLILRTVGKLGTAHQDLDGMRERGR